VVSDTPDPSSAGQPIEVTVSLDLVAPGMGSFRPARSRSKAESRRSRCPQGYVTVLRCHVGTATGQILITDGSGICGINLPSLSCSFVPTVSGAISLEARYLGDANFNLETSADRFPSPITR